MKVELSPIQRRVIRDALDGRIKSGDPQELHDLRRLFMTVGNKYAVGSEVPEEGWYWQVDNDCKIAGPRKRLVQGATFPPTDKAGYGWMQA